MYYNMEFIFDSNMLISAIHSISGYWWQIILLMIAGTIWGIVIGATPGMSVTLALILMLVPVMYLPTLLGVIFMTTIYTAAQYGGGITATILNIPVQLVL